MLLIARASQAEIRAAFDAAHAERYGYSDDDATMEITVARLTATIEQTEAQKASARTAGGDVPQPKETRQVYIDGKWTDVGIYDRDTIPAGVTMNGPMVIDQFDTTTFVHPSQSCHCDEQGFLHLSTRKSDEDDQ